jgi:hypothetical protein
MIQRLPGNSDIETLTRRQKARITGRRSHFFERIGTGAVIEHLDEGIAARSQQVRIQSTFHSRTCF